MVLTSTGSSVFGSSANRAAASASTSADAGACGSGGEEAVAEELEAGNEGTVRICWQALHLPFLPARRSSTSMPRLQWGQVIRIGMAVYVFQISVFKSHTTPIAHYSEPEERTENLPRFTT